MAVQHTTTRTWASVYALSLICGCATEMQEPSDAQGLAATSGGMSGAGGSEPATAGTGGDGKGGELAGSANGGSAGMAGTIAAAGTDSDAGSGGSGGNGLGGTGGVGGNAGVAGAGGNAGAGGGMGGVAGKGGMAGNAGAGGGAPMPQPCAKNQLKIVSATASSTENDTFPASKAFDGDMGTRWASAQSEPQWIYFDLGEVAHVSRVSITWETAYATAYRVEIAQTAAGPWTSLFQETAGNGAVDDITSLTPHNGRYVRLYASTRATQYGFSVWEFAAYGDLDETCK